MKAYLIQHATAKTEEDDPLRPLNEVGKSAMEKSADFFMANFAPIEGEIGYIAHSPKLRAQESAEILHAKLSTSVLITADENLLPDSDIAPWVKILEEADADIILVGHLPHLARLSGKLVNHDPLRPPVQFSNAGIVVLERYSENRWEVIFEVNVEP